MKKLSLNFQKGDIWTKLLWFVTITIALIVAWIVLDAVMFFLRTVLGLWGLLLLAPIVSLGIIALSIIIYPKVRDRDSYSKFTQKYL